MKKTLVALSLLVLVFGCTKKNDPENALLDYVNYRFEKSQGRDKLLDMTSGELNLSIQQMTDEEFQKFSDVAKYRRGNFNVSLKKCTDDTCFITYTLKYDMMEQDVKTLSAEIKKVAKLVREGQVWKIADVSNVKTYFDSKQPLDISVE